MMVASETQCATHWIQEAAYDSFNHCARITVLKDVDARQKAGHDDAEIELQLD
jgi:hypothetical protein